MIPLNEREGDIINDEFETMEPARLWQWLRSNSRLECEVMPNKECVGNRYNWCSTCTAVYYLDVALGTKKGFKAKT